MQLSFVGRPPVRCVTVAIAVCVLAGCRFPEGLRSAAEPEHIDCTADIQSHMKVTASAVPSKDPVELATQGGDAVLGRRILISIAPSTDVARLQVVSTALAIDPLGGTFTGWASIQSGVSRGGAEALSPQTAAQETLAGRSLPRAIDVTPGRLRITPLETASQLRSESFVLDVLVKPGAEPLDEMGVSSVHLWDASLRPIPADQASLSLVPLHHATLYDEVEGTVRMSFVVRQSRPNGTLMDCSAETSIALVDRAASTPALWDLRKSIQSGHSEFWLALFDPQAGPIRAVFTSPAQATAFADWLHQTHAVGVGRYRVGLFRPEYSDEARKTKPLPHSLVDTFQLASSDDLAELEVGRLGEQ
jgi:hypothetical protein